MGLTVHFPGDLADSLARHLANGPDEQLAFLLARWIGDEATVLDLRVTDRGAFDIQTPWHLALGDDERAAVIRWAHDGAGALIEAHSHRDSGPARFSLTDLSGLEEFVPHVWWRLQHRPYAALVFGEATFDGLAWRAGPTKPEQIEAFTSPGRPDMLATRATLRRNR